MILQRAFPRVSAVWGRLLRLVPRPALFSAILVLSSFPLSVRAQAGKVLRYVPEAIVYNKGASSVRDFLKQRRRIFAGHLWLSREQSYEVSTKNVGGILDVLFEDLEWRPKTLLWTAGGVFLEFIGRLLGAIDYRVLKKNPYTWDVAESTKSLGREGGAAADGGAPGG